MEYKRGMQPTDLALSLEPLESAAIRSLDLRMSGVCAMSPHCTADNLLSAPILANVGVLLLLLFLQALNLL